MSWTLVVLDLSAPFDNCYQSNPWCVHGLQDRLEASRTCVALLRELFQSTPSAAEVLHHPWKRSLPSVPSGAISSHGVVPKTSHFEAFHACFKVILALKLRLGFLQNLLFPISSDRCAGDDVCWKLWKSARQRMSFSATDSYLVFCVFGPSLSLSAITSTTLRPPSRDPRKTISGGPFARLPASGSDFRCRTSGSLLDCQVSHEFNVQRQRASCGPSSVSRSTLKRSGVIGCLCRSRSGFVSTPS